MIKLAYCARKRADMQPETFRKCWLEEHGPLVHSFAKTLRTKKYIQSHTIKPEINNAFVKSRGFAPPYDGITEIWWEDIEDFEALFNSPAAQEAHKRLIEDELRFIDIARSSVFLTEEHVIFDL